MWRGECFVFDDRVSVNHKLMPGTYDMCHGCRMPITDNDKLSHKYIKGVACPKCFDTTSEEQKDYINSLMRHVSIDIIEPTIHENFETSKFPAKTLIGVSAREQREGLNIIKQFYLKYPQYRFFTFKDLRGLSQDDFSKGLQDCLLGVWIDPTSGFGTFPLECMKSGVPVVGKIPNLKPSWMSEKNGIWIENQNQMVDVIADVVQTWLDHADMIGGIVARLAGIKNIVWGVHHTALVKGESKLSTCFDCFLIIYFN